MDKNWEELWVCVFCEREFKCNKYYKKHKEKCREEKCREKNIMVININKEKLINYIKKQQKVYNGTEIDLVFDILLQKVIIGEFNE